MVFISTGTRVSVLLSVILIMETCMRSSKCRNADRPEERNVLSWRSQELKICDLMWRKHKGIKCKVELLLSPQRWLLSFSCMSPCMLLAVTIEMVTHNDNDVHDQNSQRDINNSDVVFSGSLYNRFIMFLYFQLLPVLPIDLWPLTPKPWTVQWEQTLIDCASSGTFFCRLSHRETFFPCQILSARKKEREKTGGGGVVERKREVFV